MLIQKNSRKQGDVGLGSAVAAFTRMGWTVCLPLTDNQRYDLVVEGDDGLKRVSIKTTTQEVRPGTFKVTLKTCGANTKRYYETNFGKEEADWLFVLAANGDEYLIPVEVIEATQGMHVGPKWHSYRIRRGGREDEGAILEQ